ncbi:MAG: RDD family protein [Nitrososphaeria archaeon]
MFCPKCGAQVDEDDFFCHNCGFALKAQAPREGIAQPTEVEETNFDKMRRDHTLQNYWVNRAIAFIIDSVIIGAIVLLLSIAFQLPYIFSGGSINLFRSPFDTWFPFSMGIPSLLYFALLEYAYTQTFGKRVMGIRVVMKSGRPLPLGSSFLRNISKLFWPLILFDIIGGLITAGDPRQKYTDRMVGAVVEGGQAYSFIKSSGV